MTHEAGCQIIVNPHPLSICDCATGDEVRRRAKEFWAKPENKDVRLTPEEFMAMFDPDQDGNKA
jgi:hypothetical protein